MSLSWRERLQRAKKRMMEQLELGEEDWTYIWDNIGMFCSRSDELIREILDAEEIPTTQEEIDKYVEDMYQAEFDEMARDVILDIFEKMGYKIKRKQEAESKDEDEKDSDSDSDNEDDQDLEEEQEEEEKVENK